MGDASYDKKLLAEEQHRLNTFDSHRFVGSVDNEQLAKAGFFFTQREGSVKCFACDLEVKANDISSKHVDILAYHREKKPKCSFIQKIHPTKFGRCKTFLSVADSLRFEKARLDTFVNWPLTFMSPATLAEDGFYFLRTDDHCACVYCKGIIGAWEESDTPRGEHVKHFPQCPFINNKPVGNVPMAQSLILSKFNQFTIAKIYSPLDINLSCNPEDVTGHGRRQDGDLQSKVTQKMNGINLKEIGLHEYRGPKHKEYITLDSRMTSFKRWPEQVKQQPHELAEAGFYYCGPSDHVRCFHCGNGICNWENDDVPWEVHATWYPKCSYVILTKGQEYISKLQKVELCESVGNSQKIIITESELDCLMELDSMRAVCALGFPDGKVRGALRKKIESTGLPYFNFEQCMDAIFQYMEEETRQFLAHTNKEDDEDGEEPASARDDVGPLPSPPTLNANVADTSTATSSSSLRSSLLQSTSEVPLPQLPRPSVPVPILPLPQLRTHVPIMPLPPREDGDNAGPLPSPVEQVTLPSSPRLGLPQARETLNGLPLPVQSDCSKEKVPKKPVSKESSTANPKKGISPSVEHESSEKLQEELDRAREIMMCKVCLSSEMTIVFLPCAHMATCASCALNLSTCPVCRGDIKFTIKPILS